MEGSPPVSEWPTYTYPQVDKLLTLSSGTARRWTNGYIHHGKPYLPIVRENTLPASWGPGRVRPSYSVAAGGSRGGAPGL